MPSNHLILCCLLFLLSSIFLSIRVFSNESVLRIRWPEYWSFSFSISSSNEYSGLISFRIDWLDLLAVQGTLKSLLQSNNSKSSVLLSSAFFMIQLSHLYDYQKNHDFEFSDLYWQNDDLMTQFFNMLSRFVMTFLPRRKLLLISSLQSLSAMILELKKRKSVTASIYSPYTHHEVMRLDAMIFISWMLGFKLAFFTLLFHLHQEVI